MGGGVGGVAMAEVVAGGGGGGGNVHYNISRVWEQDVRITGYYGGLWYVRGYFTSYLSTYLGR